MIRASLIAVIFGLRTALMCNIFSETTAIGLSATESDSVAVSVAIDGPPHSAPPWE